MPAEITPASKLSWSKKKVLTIKRVFVVVVLKQKKKKERKNT